jgi:hypothetical protein
MTIMLLDALPLDAVLQGMSNAGALLPARSNPADTGARLASRKTVAARMVNLFT